MFKFFNVLLVLFTLGVLAYVVDNASADILRFSGKKFGIFKVLGNNSTVEMYGEIDSDTLDDFQDLLDYYPNINLIEIIECEGSNDDEINLQLSQLVNKRNINTHLRDDGIIASGGVDFFLAGVERSQGTNTMIGVHSWSDDYNIATDFPKGDPNHLPYIEYYKSVGFTQKDAEDFYYFTILSAPADNVHYMSDSEIQHYGLLTK